MIILLLCSILKYFNPMADCDPEDLSKNAACFTCMSEEQKQAVIIYLLCQILEALET